MAKKSDNNNVYGKRRRRRGTRGRVGAVHPVVVIMAVTLLAIVLNCFVRPDSDMSSQPSASAEALMKVAVPAEITQQIVDYDGFTVSFNADAHQPNYVAWELLESELDGPVGRTNDFGVDENVAGSAELSDYRRSGFDRGHMIPAADVKWSQSAMEASHLLTNICPQDHRLNSGAWGALENNCRKWAKRDSAIIIICGPVLSDYMPRSIGGGDRKIPVPERFFKVVVAPFANPPRGIGFLMNNGVVEGGIQATAVSIDEVESVTGFDFFAALPDDIEEAVELQCAFHDWQRKKR